MTKAIEGKAGVEEAVHIWKKVAQLRISPDKPQAIEEWELSTLTWLDCKTEKDYYDNRDRYKRLNNMVMEEFWMLSKNNEKAYPPLKRWNGRIGKMTDSLARVDVGIRTRVAGSNIAKALAINEGRELGMNVLGDVVDRTMKVLEEKQENPALAADFAIETVRAIKAAEQLSTMDRKEALQGITEGILKELRSKPVLIKRDQEIKDKGFKDALADSNENVAKDKVVNNDTV